MTIRRRIRGQEFQRIKDELELVLEGTENAVPPELSSGGVYSYNPIRFADFKHRLIRDLVLWLEEVDLPE